MTNKRASGAGRCINERMSILRIVKLLRSSRLHFAADVMPPKRIRNAIRRHP
jgi:hypothetical protein